MKFRKDRELAYLAGAFDERVHFRILKGGNIQVAFRSKGHLPRLLKKEFGGSCFLHGSKKRLWYKVQGRNAARLLEAVLPYLKTEAKNASKILALWDEHLELINDSK